MEELSLLNVENLDLIHLLIIPAVTVITQIFNATAIKREFLPLVAMGVGVALALATKQDWVIGAIFGLSASGLYDTTKLLKNFKKTTTNKELMM